MMASELSNATGQPNTFRSLTLPIVLSLIMALTSAVSDHLKPDQFLSSTRPYKKIEPLLAKEFGDWTQLPDAVGVVNPQQNQLIDKLYSETIFKVYANKNGDRVMLSIAHGKNQSDAMQLHTPEICYPAQGFEVKSLTQGQLELAQGTIPVRRMETSHGLRRFEPITYWSTIGDHVVINSTDKKLHEIRYAFKGYVADGLLFRVSTIDTNTQHAFLVHQRFVEDFLKTLPAPLLKQISGLTVSP